MSLDQFTSEFARYGYVATFVSVMMASAGIPVPAGELLLAAAAFAAQTHQLNLGLLMLVAATAGAIGGALGYTVGRTFGTATLMRYGRYVGLGPARVRLGQFLFIEYGGRIVLFIRFIALVGPFGGVLAGLNRMHAGRFMLFNVIGGAAWAVAVSLGGYLFSEAFTAVGPTLGIGAIVLVLIGLVGLGLYLRRHEKALQQRADDLLGA